MYRKKRLNDMLEIPKEVYSNIPNFIITGFEEMIIENYKGILEYEDFYVRVNTFIGIINIHGINLKLDKFANIELKLKNTTKDIDESLKGYYTLHLDKINVFLDLSSCIDKKEEIAKLQKEKENLMKEVKRSEGMLNNENFISKAPEKLVNAEREKLEKYSQMLKKVEARIDEINN